MSARIDTLALSVASLVNGAAAYAIVIVVSRTFDDEAFASFSVAWSLWALGVAILVFPIQHWIIWRSATDGDMRALRAAKLRLTVLVGAAVMALFVLGSSPRLFPSRGPWGPILAAVGASSAVLGVGRGLLASKGSYLGVATVIGAENVLRLAVVVLLLVLSLGPTWIVASLAAGVLVLLPFVRRLRIEGNAPSRVHVFSELGALAGATALAQVIVQFPPAFAEWLGEPPVVVAGLFATFSIGRAPLLVVLALSARITEPLTRMLQADQKHLRRAGTVFGFGALSLTFTAAGVGYWAGPTVVAWFFGPTRALSQSATALVFAGLALAMVGLLLILALMAKKANWQAAVHWLIGLLLAVGLAVVGLGIPAAFLAAELAAVALSFATLWKFISAGQELSRL